MQCDANKYIKQQTNQLLTFILEFMISITKKILVVRNTNYYSLNIRMFLTDVIKIT